MAISEHFGLAELPKAQEQLLILGEPLLVCTTYLEEGQTFPCSPECAKMPPATSTTLGGHIPSLCCCFPAKNLPQIEQERPDLQSHGAAPWHPLTHPIRKKPSRAGGGLIDLSTEDTSFSLITPFCPVTNILKTYKKKKKKNQGTPIYTERRYKTSTEAPRNTNMNRIRSRNRNRKDTELHQTVPAHVCGSRWDWFGHTNN